MRNDRTSRRLCTAELAGFQGYEVQGWVGLFAPHATPKTVCEGIAADLSDALKTPTVQERYAALRFEAPEFSLQSFNDLIRRETDAWAGVIKAAEVRLD